MSWYHGGCEKYKVIFVVKSVSICVVFLTTFATNYFQNNSNNIKKTWQGIKQLITLSNKKFHTPTTTETDSQKITNTIDIANAFNTYFANIGSNLAASIPSLAVSYTKYLKSPTLQSFALYPTTSWEVEQEINNLCGNKSTGPFSIPTKLLRLLKSILSEPLSYLYNCSFNSGIVPNKFKIAKVIPIFLKGILYCSFKLPSNFFTFYI